jgi:tRNA U34 5-methylaminomethyl-2-thiouridine-forming methyltransferase MnmC
MSTKHWRREWTADGSPTLVHPEHGEACHNRVGAWLESWERYVRACRLPSWFAERAGRELRLCDVGTGLGLNLAAALCAAEEGGGVLVATSFESEAAVLDEAASWCAEGDAQGQAADWWPVVQAALESARRVPGEFVPLGSRHRLRLCFGDARSELAALGAPERFDACFFDPFSAASDDGLWGADFLLESARRLAPGGRLTTYSERADARLAWAAAGLAVAEGEPLGRKRAGTVALRALTAAEFAAHRPSDKLRSMLARRLPGWCAERGLAVPPEWFVEHPKIDVAGSKGQPGALE